MTKWREVRLGDVVENTQYGFTASSTENDTGIKFLRITDIVDYFIDWKSVPYCEIDEKNLKKYKIDEDDLLIARTGATAGVYKVIDSKFYKNTVFASYLIRFKLNKDLVNSLYIKYCLGTELYKKFIKNYISGSAQPNINAKILSRFKFNLPDLKTQEKITKVLSTYDELIENNNRRIELLEQMAEEIYKEWFVRMRFPGHEETKFEKGIPEGWEVKRVKDIVSRLKAGYYYKKDEVFENGDTIVIDQSEKPFLGFHFNRPDHVADIDSPIILFGDHSCKMNLMIRNFSVSENVIPFKSVEKNNEIFLFYATKRLIETQEYKRHWNEFTNKKIFIPDDILKLKFINNVRDIILQIQKYKEQNQNLIKQRDMLLPRLMNGTIEVE